MGNRVETKETLNTLNKNEKQCLPFLVWEAEMAEESGRDGIDWLVLLGRGRQRCLEVRDERVVFVGEKGKLSALLRALHHQSTITPSFFCFSYPK